MYIVACYYNTKIIQRILKFVLYKARCVQHGDMWILRFFTLQIPSEGPFGVR